MNPLLRSSIRTLWAWLVFLTLAKPGYANTNNFEQEVKAQLDTAETARNSVKRLLDERMQTYQSRLRAFYKHTRNTGTLLRTTARVRSTPRILAAVRRATRRDKVEIGLLRSELSRLVLAYRQLEVRLREMRRPLDLPQFPWPVRGNRIAHTYGVQKVAGVPIRHRGVEIETTAGREIHSPMVGRIRFSGRIAGIGKALIVDYDDILLIVGGLDKLPPTGKQKIGKGQILGHTQTDALYIEVRAKVGPEAYSTIDPSSLFLGHPSASHK